MIRHIKKGILFCFLISLSFLVQSVEVKPSESKRALGQPSLSIINKAGVTFYVQLEGWDPSIFEKMITRVTRGKYKSWKPFFKDNITQNVIRISLDSDLKTYATITLDEYDGYDVTVPKGYKRKIFVNRLVRDTSGEIAVEYKEEGRKLGDPSAEFEKTVKAIGKKVVEQTVEKGLKVAKKARKLAKDIADILLDPVKKGMREDPKGDVYKVIHGNPYKHTPAEVRTKDPFGGKEEGEFLKKREKITRDAQAKYMGEKFLPREKTLQIAYVLSGGGERAELTSTGALAALQKMHGEDKDKKINLFDTFYCVSTLSGSTWWLGPWLMHKKPIDEFIKFKVDASENGLIFKQPKLDAFDALNLAKVNFALGRPINMLEIYGMLIGASYLRGLGFAGNPQRLYPYEMAELGMVKDARVPLPIFSAMTSRTGTADYKIIWFTPFEVGSRFIGKNGFAVPIWAYGRMFEDGKSVSINTEGKPLYGPSVTMGHMLATCGSAPGVTLGEAYKEALGQMLEGSGVVKDAVEVLLTKTDFEKLRAFFPLVWNPLYGMKEYGGFASHRYFRPVDTGIEGANDLWSTWRGKDYKPDIIFNFSPSRISASRELKFQSKMAAKLGLPYPEITIDGKDFDQRVVHVFKNKPKDSKFKDSEIPWVVYIPLVSALDLIKEFKDNPKYQDVITRIGSFNYAICFKSGTCGTFNFMYKPDKDGNHPAKQVMALSEFLVLMQEEMMVELMKERKAANRVRDGINPVAAKA